MAEFVNTAGLELVKKSEGLNLSAYQDCVGVWTIGWGHTGKVDGVPVKKGMKISREKAEELLKNDLKTAWAAVCSCPQAAELNENQKAALCSFEFNLGKLWQICYIWKDGSKVRARTVGEIGDAIRLYNKAGGKYVQGLAERREEEQALFFTPVGSAVRVKKRLPDMPTVRRGDTGQPVSVLQKLLGGLEVDGEFGQKTEDAVRTFQSAHNLDVDGICGPRTWAEILKA